MGKGAGVRVSGTQGGPSLPGWNEPSWEEEFHLSCGRGQSGGDNCFNNLLLVDCVSF